MESIDHQAFMSEALSLARGAAKADEVPVGAVLVFRGKVIGRGANRREASQDPTAHAEMIAIREAAGTIGSWRLEQTTLYVTLEPCPMCAGAILNARIPLVVYGCEDPKAGAVRSLYKLLEDPRLNHRAAVRAGVCAAEASALLKSFFGELRRKKN